MLSSNKESLFIGNGFTESQILVVMSLAKGYCDKRGIKRIVFEEPLPREVHQIEILREIMSTFEVIELRRQFGNVESIIRKMTNAVIELIPAINLAINASKANLLKEKSWYEFQLQHAVWDQARLTAPDGTIDLKLHRRMVSALAVRLAVSKARTLVKKYNVTSAFLGHTVYSGRGLLAELNSKDVRVYAHALGVMYLSPKNRDLGYSIMDKSDWNEILKLVSESDAVDFWNRRRLGKSRNADAVQAAQKKKAIEEDTPRNIVFLHVFRDSPFNRLETSRVFIDYIDWLTATLRIIKDSKETWLLKTHPVSIRWGENQHTWLKAIGKLVFQGAGWPTHISISDSEYSNVDLLEHARRVVTFNGTAHIEAACWGIRPISVCDVTLSSAFPKQILKPDSLRSYEEMLKISSGHKMFSLSDHETQNSRRVLFTVEEYLSFKKDVGFQTVYRGDDDQVFLRDMTSVISATKSSSHKLSLQGQALASGAPRTFAFNFFGRAIKEFSKQRVYSGP
jgi:hypothetical protein